MTRYCSNSTAAPRCTYTPMCTSVPKCKYIDAKILQEDRRLGSPNTRIGLAAAGRLVADASIEADGDRLVSADWARRCCACPQRQR